MDNNVSKNTLSYKFLKLRLNEEKSTISVKNLLKRDLLQTLDLYGQRENLNLDLKFISTILERKIVLLPFSSGKLSPKNNIHQVLSKLQTVYIGYSCSIVFSLARFSPLSSQVIANNLVSLLALNRMNTTAESDLKLRIESAAPGWLNFYFDSISIASWLEQLLICLETLPIIDRHCSDRPMRNEQLAHTSKNLFPLQYIHARYCSLLRLGEREKLITLKDDDFLKVVWHLEQPKPISWLDEEQNLWLTQVAEYNLLRQLLLVTDSFAGESANWIKLAFSLSKMMTIFEAECRFLGEVKRKTPQKAIARLGLIALAQYWLQKLLREKLNVAAPTTL